MLDPWDIPRVGNRETGGQIAVRRTNQYLRVLARIGGLESAVRDPPLDGALHHLDLSLEISNVEPAAAGIECGDYVVQGMVIRADGFETVENALHEHGPQRFLSVLRFQAPLHAAISPRDDLLDRLTCKRLFRPKVQVKRPSRQARFDSYIRHRQPLIADS